VIDADLGGPVNASPRPSLLASLTLLAAVLVGAPASAAPEALVGKLREVSGGPGGRAEAELTVDGGAAVLLDGRLPEDDVVLRRLSGVRVRVTGERAGPRFVVDAIEIVDVGNGQRPRLGVLGRLQLGDTTRLVFVDDAGAAELLPAGLAAKLDRHVGARLWVLGVKKNGELIPTRFAIVRPAPPADAPPPDGAKPEGKTP
jgi:hypothetical protein